MVETILCAKIFFLQSAAFFTQFHHSFIIASCAICRFSLRTKNDVSWRHIQQFACVANEQALPCINPNLSTPRINPDAATWRCSFMLDHTSVCPLGSFRTMAAYGLRVWWRGEETEQSKGAGIVLLDLPRSPAGCAASYKHEIVPQLATNPSDHSVSVS